jgi:hypothetical protein
MNNDEQLKAVLEENDDIKRELETEREISRAAEKNYRDLVAFLNGETPETYCLHVKECADRLRKDKARLDWLLQEIDCVEYVFSGDKCVADWIDLLEWEKQGGMGDCPEVMRAARAAIDAAMAQANGG